MIIAYSVGSTRFTFSKKSAKTMTETQTPKKIPKVLIPVAFIIRRLKVECNAVAMRIPATRWSSLLARLL